MKIYLQEIKEFRSKSINGGGREGNGLFREWRIGESERK